MVWLGTGPHHRESRNRGAMAPVWIRALLARHLQSAPREWEEENSKRFCVRSLLSLFLLVKLFPEDGTALIPCC